MDHIVCLDAGAMEMENLINGNKSMILRGNDLTIKPYSHVSEGDVLYFVNGLDNEIIRARGVVSGIFRSSRLSVEESFEIIIRNQDQLQLPDNQFYTFAGKQYLVLISLENAEEIFPFRIDNLTFDGYDDWLPIGNIDLVTAH